ncbi:arginase [Paenibacillus sp. IB182496]|uniref:Arginase n=1 Tax=Paenibacillus sabuli TaxID=2772509 RepID=A0A927BSN5_9BACL|nr:arginase [Paenibacillus sabuli]MBD2844960.1 arginase [Paenibacillus sabuli]
MATRGVHIINVPFGLGAGTPGTEHGPEAIWRAGLEARLAGLGLQVTKAETVRLQEDGAEADRQDGPQDGAETRARNRAAVERLGALLAPRVRAAAAGGDFPLVLGGDHSIATGTLAGLTAHYPRLGVIWFDAHSDLNTEATTPSGNMHGMSLAAALGRTIHKLTDIPGAGPLVRPERVVLVGARDLDAGERELIRREGIACFSMHEIDKLGIARVMEEAVAIAGRDADGVHLSFDIDSVDPREAPGAGTPVAGGVSYREAHFALELLAESGKVTSMEMVEVNPRLDPEGRTAALAAELIGSLLGERIL